MKTKKIMAAVLASLCATAAMSTVVSATPVGVKKEEVDVTFTVDGTLEGSAVLDAIFGDYKQNAFELITMSSDDPFALIYPADWSRLDKWVPVEGSDVGLCVSGLCMDIGAKDPTERIKLPASTVSDLPEEAYATSQGMFGITPILNQPTYWKLVPKENKKITVKAHIQFMGPAQLKDKTEDNSSATSDTTSNTTNDPGATDETSSGTSNTENSGSTSGSNSSDASTTKVESTVTLKDGKLEGEELTKAIIGDSKNEWKNIEGLTFTSDKPFSVQFDVKAGAVEGDETATTYIMGVSELKKDALPDKAYNTTWALSKDEIAAMLAGDATGKSLSIKSKDGSDIEVKVTATFKAASGTDNKNTGIALAVAPIALAGAAVIVASVAKKKK